MSTVINLVSSDPQLAQLVRETGMPCVVVSRDALMTSRSRAPSSRRCSSSICATSAVPPALAQLKRQHPDDRRAAGRSELDPALMLEAMRAGVNECVTAPGPVPELQAAVKRLMGNLGTDDARRDLRVHRRQGGSRRDDRRGQHRDGAGASRVRTRRC